ncbi:MAG TPA: hypothetical protein VNM68_03050 [Candidatus Polarisedimenticolia bacterium]|nr:hypothetical protein [Candidatus Polarisedimenticolia bacterium]
MGWIEDLLKDYPELSGAKDRLERIAQQLRHLEAENRKLKEEKAEWTKHPAPEPQIQFVPYGGVLWEQFRGTIKSIAYCPHCKIVLTALPPGSDEMLVCAQCNFTAPFLPSQVGAFAKRLESELVSA